MVQRLSVLLMGSAFFGAMACAPDALKIHIPPTGVDSINQEDLRRAYWALEKGVDPTNWWTNRAKQFHLKPFKPGCFVHEGTSDEGGTIYARSTPMELTVMASLAKALDGMDVPRSWVFCLAERAQEENSSFVIELKDVWDESPAFMDVDFSQLSLEVKKRVVEYKILE